MAKDTRGRSLRRARMLAVLELSGGAPDGDLSYRSAASGIKFDGSANDYNKENKHGTCFSGVTRLGFPPKGVVGDGHRRPRGRSQSLLITEPRAFEPRPPEVA